MFRLLCLLFLSYAKRNKGGEKVGEGGGGEEDEEGRGKRLRDGSGREAEGGRLLAVTGGAVKRKRGERERE